MTETRPDAGAAGGTPEQAGSGSLERLFGTADHRTLGVVFIGFSLLFLIVMFVGRLLFGIDGATDNGVLSSYAGMTDLSSQVGLVLLGVVPLLIGLAVYVVPLQVGSPSIAFPRAVAFSLWMWVLSSGVFITSVALDGGVGGGDDAASRLGNVSTGALLLSLGLATVAVMTTVVAHRPFGMGLARVPLFAWSMLVAGAVWVVSFGSAFAHVLIGQISHQGAQALAANFSAGLSWLLRAPSVYMVAVPVLGIASDVVARSAGRRLAPYFVFQTSIAAFAVLSFGAWAQVPASSQNIVWTGVALLIGLPVLGLLGGLADALRRGPVKVDAALIGSLLSVLLMLGAVAGGLLIALNNAGHGQLIGLSNASLAASQAFFVVGAALVGAVAGLCGWSPLIFGGVASPKALGALLVLAGGVALMGTAALVAGLVQIDGADTGAQAFAALGGLGAVLALLGVLGSWVAALGAAKEGTDGESNDLSGLTLEWAGGPRPIDAAPVQSEYPLLDDTEENA
ncbi:MAG: cbb3-type cytochrome c oxidase subunit I [Actinomycetes bacterium]